MAYFSITFVITVGLELLGHGHCISKKRAPTKLKNKSILQELRFSLIAQLVKNLPSMQETLVQFLGQEDPLEKGWATHSSILGLPWWLSGKESACQCRKHRFISWSKKIPAAAEQLSPCSRAWESQ